MAYVKIFVDVCCPECDSNDVEITDYDEMSYLCHCNECGKNFEEFRD